MGYPTQLNRAQGDIVREREAQDAKWGEQNHDPMAYMTILMEEVGEFAKEALHDRFHDPRDGDTTGARERMRKEAVQVAAVAMAIVECIDRGKWRWPGANVEALTSRDETSAIGLLSAEATARIMALKCECDLRARAWNPATRCCETCGRVYEESRIGI
jgi:NTP pyrophosphatase (non-canonical NTP hydrolase)